jgi:aminopeptidase-like protein
MVNNELSGPIVATFLAKWISELVNRKYTYRIIIIPETIGSVIYLGRNYQSLQRNVIAGLNSHVLEMIEPIHICHLNRQIPSLIKRHCTY